MDKNKTSSPKKQTSSKKLTRIIKKKPLLLITAVMAVVIIVLAVLLITTNASRSSAVLAETTGTNSSSANKETEETKEPGYSYDEAKWMCQMLTGYLSYDDDNYKSTIGIDVSEWSLDIDWEKVKAAGIDFAICRVGYRGYGTGKFEFDKKLEEYLKGAEEAGIETGVYFVTQAINEEEAVEEAEAVLEKIKDFHITQPVYIDCEANTGEDTRTDDLTKEQFTKNAIAFCKRIEEAGYRGGIYSNNTWIKKNLDMSQLTDYDIWFAKYTKTPETEIPFNVWQYASDGVVDGIETAADLNIRIEKK